MKARDYRKSNRGGIMVWLLILCILGAIGYFITKHPDVFRLDRLTAPVIAKPSPAQTPEPVPEAPEPTPEATPTPSATPSATPTPTPIVESTPTPPAKVPPDFATIAKTAALWPREVVLLKPAGFPIVFNGKVAGQTQAPAGVTVRLVRVLPDLSNPQVEVELQNSRAILPASSTDLAVRSMNLREVATARAAAVAAASVAAQPTPAAAASASTPGIQSNDLFVVEVTQQNGSVGANRSGEQSDAVFLKVKLANNTATAYPGLTATVYTLAESLSNPDKKKVIGITVYSFPLPPMGRYEKLTDKADPGTYEEDFEAARYGYKYSGWLLRLADKAGKVVFEKASTPEIMKSSAEIANLPYGGKYTTQP